MYDEILLRAEKYKKDQIALANSLFVTNDRMSLGERDQVKIAVRRALIQHDLEDKVGCDCYGYIKFRNGLLKSLEQDNQKKIQLARIKHRFDFKVKREGLSAFAFQASQGVVFPYLYYAADLQRFPAFDSLESIKESVFNFYCDLAVSESDGLIYREFKSAIRPYCPKMTFDGWYLEIFLEK